MKQVYAYSVLADQVSDEYHGPDLVIESLYYGNLCRFMNDCYG